ncbi:capsular polysaccharide synthesis protein [Enterocloster sp. OA13]|uniref:capsular polysaccharide synthesis protein n=1 Tax=Enterocloster sp. OA13 TaxID=2914161 RepID=UPI000470E35A|nr:capsular polysaccharide synthesis protein [Enterocloster sp. OA13]
MFGISEAADLIKIFESDRPIVLYGAGFYLNQFLTELLMMNHSYIKRIECILVLDMKGNPSDVMGIPVKKYDGHILTPQHDVLLTLGKRYFDSVYGCLEGSGSRIVSIDFDMFQRKPYQEVYASIEPFLSEFLEKHRDGNYKELNSSRARPGDFCVRAWSCWWQGEDEAPELVKACWNSQRKNLPEGIPLVIITRDNFGQYIALPDYILEKVERGSITLTTLSDIIRVNLLYKFGGIWFDSTLLLTGDLPVKVFDFPIYTRTLPETQYCTKTVWADWFISATPGHLLFRFVSDAFNYYYSVYDSIRYYFMIDYLIAICCNTFSGVQDDLMNIPNNNETALELGRHLQDEFDDMEYRRLTSGSYVQKLSYKISWKTDSRKEDSIYWHVIKNNQ